MFYYSFYAMRLLFQFYETQFYVKKNNLSFMDMYILCGMDRVSLSQRLQSSYLLFVIWRLNMMKMEQRMKI